MKKSLLIVCLILLSMTVTMAGDYDQVAKVVSPHRGDVRDLFGRSACIDGNYAIIGSCEEDSDELNNNPIANAGAAFVYFYNGSSWVFQAKVVAPTRGIDDNFGWSSSVSGDYAIIGAYREDEDSLETNNLGEAGSAYVFKRSGSSWSIQAKLVASDRGASDNFAYSVSISGDYAIVGAYNEDEDASGGNLKVNAGSAYIFKRNGDSWTQQAKLVATDRNNNDQFGWSVSISGDYAIVGAYEEDEDVLGGNPKGDAGSAYIFKRDGESWSQEAKIVASDRNSLDQFGFSVSLSGDYAIIGARYEDQDSLGNNTLSASGSAYIFKRNGSLWLQEDKISASDRGENDQFGCAVGIKDDYVIVGASLEDEDASGGNTFATSGSAYIFKRNEGDWSEQAKIVALDREAGDRFGYAVSISETHSIVTAILEKDDELGNNSIENAGSAYIFSNPASQGASPITLSDFEAHIDKGRVLISWETASETNNTAFIIYRNDEILTRIEGAGTTSETQSYTYIDEMVVPGVEYTYVLADVDHANNITHYEDYAIRIILGEDIKIEDYALSDAYPNPFNPITIIDYQLPQNSDISLNVYDLRGSIIKTLVSGYQNAGNYTVHYHAGDLPSGVYLYRLLADNEIITKKMVLLK